MRSRYLVVVAMSLCGATACATVIGLGDYEVASDASDAAVLTESGVDSATDASVDVVRDAAPEAARDAARECGSAACTSPSADGGFTFVLAGNAACPSGYKDSVVVSDPDAGAGACACGPCNASASCASGVINAGSGATCSNFGATFLNSTPGVCANSVNTNITTPDHLRVDAPPPSNKTCNAPVTAVRSNVATASSHVCTPLAEACASDACEPPSPFKACLVANGDLDCPAGYVKRLAGDDVTIACDACSCTTTATCSGKLEIWSASNCSGTLLSLSSGTCFATTAGMPVKSYKWTADPAATSCTATPPAQPSSVTLAKPRTLCCPP